MNSCSYMMIEYNAVQDAGSDLIKMIILQILVL